jgi:phospholipase A1
MLRVSLFLIFITVFLFAQDSNLTNNVDERSISVIKNDRKMRSFILNKVDKVDAQTQSFIIRYLNSDFGLYAYKTNYLLPLSVSSSKYLYWSDNGINSEYGSYYKKYEAEFQLSLKKPVSFNFFGLNEIIALAYTQKVWWQIYAESSPFRETNYEPEIYVTIPSSKELDKKSGIKGIRFGFVHESNGRFGLQSRSWNRLYFSTIWQHSRLFTNLRVWYRIPEDDKSLPTQLSGDDNPNISDYMGYGDISLSYINGKSQFGLVLRNNLDLSGENKGAVVVDWSYPLPYAKDSFWYLKIFSGYGESLIDYDRHVDKISLGFSFSRGLF